MKRITIIAFAAALASAAPVRAQNREHLQMAAELQILRTQNQELANAVTQLMQLLTETTKALNTRIDQTNDAVRKGFADQSLSLNGTAGDVRKIQAQTQDAATRIGELKEEVEALRSSIPALLSRMTPVSDPTAAADPAAVSSVPPPAPSTLPSTVGLSPDRVFNTAHSDYAAGNYDGAIQGFQEFLKAFPTSARADDAQQYIGDAEYAQSRYQQAVAAFDLVIKNYPKGDQVAWAYYKRGLAQSRLQQNAAARASFEAVVKQFPDSEPAPLAAGALQRLDTAPPPAPTPRKP